MITVYKRGKLPTGLELVEQNDIYFNKITSALLDDQAKEIILQIDHSELLDKYTILSRFDGTALNIDKLSTGCKTALNILYGEEKVFDIRECGDNALDVIYRLQSGNVYCDYPFISFDMDKVKVYDGDASREIDSYEELKEWWLNES